MDLSQLRRQLAVQADQGRALELGGRGRLTCDLGDLNAEALCAHGCFDANTSSVVASRVAEQHAVGMGVFLGNPKDAGCAVAAGVCALALLKSLDEGWLSSADAVPSLRRFALRAHDGIGQISSATIDPAEDPTTAGRRQTLEGIGCAALALVARPGWLGGIHIGDARSYLLREGEVRALTLPHTLDRRV